MKNKLLFTAVALLGLITATMAQVPNYVPTDGLVGYWPFNGNANDQSGNGNDGTVNGATLTTDRFGITNASYDFNGTNQRIVVPDNNSLSFTNATFTLAYWVNIETPITNGAPTICKYGITNSFEYGNFVYSDNSVSFSTYNLGGTCGVNGSALSNSIPYQNNWHHFVSVHNGNNGASLYIDGVLISNSTTSNTNCSMGNGTGSLYFGFGGGWNQQSYFNGKLDDIGIWNKALTPQEITNLYNASLPPAACLPDYVPTDGLVGYWPFCGNANDESGNGNNGTVNGAILSIDRFGDANSAFSFNGIDNKILFNLNSISNTFPLNTESTSSIWMKSLDQNGPLISLQGSGGIEYLLHVGTLADIVQSPGNFGMLVRDNCCGTGNNIFGSSVVDNNWHMITVVRLSDGTLQLYKDAILQVTSSAGQSGTLTFNPTTMAFGADESWIIGAQSGNCNSCNTVDQRHLNGILDDAGIWNRALTQQEITALFNSQSCTASIAAAGPTTFCQGGSVVLNANTGAGLTYQWRNNGNNISGATAASYTANTAGSYTVVVTDGNGCSATSTATTVTVNPTPNATINASGSTTFCQGGSVVLNANTGAGLTYQWRNNGNNITGATAANYTANTTGSYSVVVTNGNGCAATSTATTVTVNPTPNATINAGGSTTFCQGGSVVLNANSGTGLTYQWRNNGNNISGATNASYTANAAGSYTVRITNSNGCTATSTATTVIINPTPTATITAGGATTFCQGGSVVLNANSGTGLTYQWRNNSINITGATNASYSANAAGSYTLVVTNSSSCSATSSAVSVTVNPIPLAPQVSSNSPITGGGTIQLNAVTVQNATYSWVGPNGFISTQQNPTIPNATAANSGSYSLTINVNGCTSTPSATQVIVVGNQNLFTLYLDTIPGINGQQVLMSIRVKNFNNMLSAQFTLQFDPSVINYAGFLNPGIPSITGGSFGQTQINNGVLTFAWSQPNVTPVSLEDDELLVNLRFNVIGAGGSFSPITFINSPTPIEFVDESFVPLNAYQTLPGRVDVLNIASLSGNLKTETGQPVRSATVASTGFATESAQSNLEGQYSLLLPQGQSYSISPSKGNDTLVTNGITTLDVLLIQRHILNILPLNSPYKIIAADVNQSGTVTSADLNLINALILANISAYPSGQFWSFVPDNHVFSNPQNPFPFPATRTYNNLNTAVNQDFFGMKLGDVNNSYNPALARLSRSENAVELYIENQDVTEEATIQVPVKVKNFSEIAGFQFAVQWDAQVLRYIEINPANGGLDVNKGETMTEAGKLNINWIDPNASAISLDEESVLFNITFEVVGGLGSNTDVEIYSSLTTPVEIITAELEVAEHSLQEGKIAVSTPSSVLEIEAADLTITAFPNPFKVLTTLSVESSVQRLAILEVYDISGRLISSERITLQQGNTQHQLNVSKASGNYMIVLSDASKGNRLATLKLVKE